MFLYEETTPPVIRPISLSSTKCPNLLPKSLMCQIFPFTGVLIVFIPIDLEKLFVQLRKWPIVFTFDKNISILNVIGNGIFI